jgi:DNA-binding CsgD family transcriptional regulator
MSSSHSAFCVAGYLAELFDIGLDPVSFRTRVARILRSAVDCQMVSFVLFHPSTRQMDIDFDPFHPSLPGALAGFARHMAPYPCFNCDPTAAGGKPFIRADFLDDATFYNAPVYLEGFKVAGISDHAAMLIYALGDTVFFVGMEKLDGKVFTPAHRGRMEVLQPHFINAWVLCRAVLSLAEAIADSPYFHQLGLTIREMETLSLLAGGKTNAEIAAVLGLGLPTVKTHVTGIFNKLGVDNRHAAILRAHELSRPPAPPAKSTTRRASATAA